MLFEAVGIARRFEMAAAFWGLGTFLDSSRLDQFWLQINPATEKTYPSNF
jgi:hypothetical protein